MAVAGRGSFGRVLEVVDTQGDAPRALKIVPRGTHEGTLLDEFEQLARLRHPSLPRVFEVGRTAEPIDDIPEGATFFVAEWIAGKRCTAMPWTSAAAVWSLLADIAGALATIHAAGLVHADVAPNNILVTGERAVLVDLGLAAPVETGGARGTPAYMAPEALAGHVEPRSDLYGLGATIVRMLTGRPPFEGGTLGELVQRIVAGRAAPALPGMPRPLADLIGRMMHRDLDARPASALAVLDELDQLAPALDITKTSRRARPNVGPPPAPASWPGAGAWIDRLASELATPQLIVIVGSLATGARQLADAALRRLQLDDVAHGRANVPVIAG
ncbi:MAG: serine/threonine protein kinase, partial [Deltaproteobacteria bacterium]|nr:serine/threonine protein kinase [Deltaproteobacteria bacterium]